MEQEKNYLGKKTINGREFEYGDTIHHETVTVFDWKDRLKILFGRKCRIVSQIYTKQSCNVAGSEAQAYCDSIIKRDPKTMGLVQNGDGINFTNSGYAK